MFVDQLRHLVKRWNDGVVDVENKAQAMDEKNKKKGDGKTLDCCINGKT